MSPTPLPRNIFVFLFVICCIALHAFADEEGTDQVITSAHYANGDVIPYLQTATKNANPKYALILMPGGAGRLEPETYDGKVFFKAKGNFLIRSRKLFADDETVVLSTDSTASVERMGAIAEDATRRYPGIKIYVIGTSRSTTSTMMLAEGLDGKVAGFVHTSSKSSIASFDTRALKSRQLIVHHKNDACNETGLASAQYNHEKYGTDFIVMEGGVSLGDPCEAFAYHGYNGIEKETVDKIKAWIKQPGS